ncbi:protein FAR1-RELATED SEQUENCE 1-like [Bidens hawaiensis]|uniref:protein FAR1-RELATED SEQUENCE 1-like n=1 Tax=Bidens hawaiensis TaxID=980011 RepID=UPI00404A938B
MCKHHGSTLVYYNDANAIAYQPVGIEHISPISGKKSYYPDPAMKRAIEDVFPNTRHRLCMWHIVLAKVGSKIYNETDFKERLCDIVWTDQIFAEHFENEWGQIMHDFHLTDHEWLTDIYEMRSSWIPAFYRDENMSGLMRTSSRSEKFFAHFDSAIEHQRNEHGRNDHDSRYKSPRIWSNFPLERQAAEIYTRNIFFDVQLEIDTSIHQCQYRSYHVVGDFIKFYIKDFQFYPSSTWEVMYRSEDLTVYCSCKRSEQFGLLCRHIFFVHRMGEANGIGNNNVYSVVRDMNKVHDHVINQLVGDMEKLSHYAEYINNYKAKVDEIEFVASLPSKRDMFADILNTNQPTHVNIRAPMDRRNKGCGVHNRIRSQREKAISQAGNPQGHAEFVVSLGTIPIFYLL